MRPDVILIVCDTIRKDMMGLYGGSAKTPNLERLAKEAMVYGNCISPATWTFPSHASLFTGLYPNENGVHEIVNGEKVRACIKSNVSMQVSRLPEWFEDKGYDTYCVSNNFMLSKESGFQFGFRTFNSKNYSPWLESEIAMEARGLGADPLQVLVKLVESGRLLEIPKYAKELIRVKGVARRMNYPIDKGMTKLVEIVKKLQLEPSFFLFMNIFDAHEPYPSFSDKDAQDAFADIRPINSAVVAKLKSEYVKIIELVDTQIGELLEDLKSRGLYDNSMIIITSDHGQAFDEHGFMYHGAYLYDEIVRVPLIIKYPRGKKFPARSGYQSLAYVRDLIEDVLEDGDDRTLTRQAAFAESYGTIDAQPDSYKATKEYVKDKYEKVRAAVFMDGYKLNVNGSDGKIEEFLKDGKPVDPKSHREAFDKLSEELKQFKSGEKFLLPEL